MNASVCLKIRLESFQSCITVFSTFFRCVTRAVPRGVQTSAFILALTVMIALKQLNEVLIGLVRIIVHTQLPPCPVVQ